MAFSQYLGSGVSGKSPISLQGGNNDLSNFTCNSPVSATTTSSTSYADVVNYTGSGVIDLVAFASSASAGIDAEIIIDGVTVYTKSVATGTKGAIAIGGGVYDGNSTSWSLQACGSVPFNSSFRVRHKATAAFSVSSYVSYRRVS